jgi:hypothetical protein
MTDNFTPSPWKRKYNEQTGVEEIWSGEGLVAEVHPTNSDHGGMRISEETNARLIAAAPAMLELIRHEIFTREAFCVDIPESCELCEDYGFGRCRIPEHIQIIEYIEGNKYEMERP